MLFRSHGVCRDIQRVEDAIVGVIVYILSAAELKGKIREGIMCLVEAHPEILRYGKVLALPVLVRTPDAVRALEYENDAYEEQECC